MPTNEEIIRQVYEAAEASVRDTAKFISLFAEDGYFLDVPSGNRWVGSDVGQPVEALFVAFPDMHRELLQIHAMGDVVYVEFPEKGRKVHAGEDFVVVESVKGANDVFSPVSGTVLEVNDALEESPELLNQDAYANWLVRLEVADPGELNSLLDHAAYAALLEELEAENG